MKSFKLVVVFYLFAVCLPHMYSLIMPPNCEKQECNYVTVGAQPPGTILFIETSTFYNHVMIYTDETTVVESVRPGESTSSYDFNETLTIPGEAIYTLTLKESNSYNNIEVMNEAATIAASTTGSMYDINFLNNKNHNYTELNCSELIWGSYYEAGIDVDGNGGLGVYPNDIYNSEYLEVQDIYYP